MTDEPVVKLAPERKHLTNLIKMVAYQAESDLLRLVAPHYPSAAKPQPKRMQPPCFQGLGKFVAACEQYRLLQCRADDEGRTLIQSALASTADLQVTKTELRITLAAQSSPHRTRAIAALCELLNKPKTIFPGSRLRLRYAIRAAS